MTFDDSFHDSCQGWVLWANHRSLGRIRIGIGPSELEDGLGLDRQVHRCELYRQPIEAASRRAIAARPGKAVELLASDFP
jgi:hypothetical protein